MRPLLRHPAGAVQPAARALPAEARGRERLRPVEAHHVGRGLRGGARPLHRDRRRARLAHHRAPVRARAATCCSSKPSTSCGLNWAPPPRSAWATCAGVGSYFTSQRLYGDETQYTGWDGNNADCILIWCRQERSRGYYDWLTVKRAQERGAKVICVDPRYTCTASKADLWLPIRPGSDMALVLAFINEIVHSDKCATEFARFYTNAPFFIDEKDAEGNGTGYQLRESLMKRGRQRRAVSRLDEAHDQLIFWNGDWQNKKGLGEEKVFQWLDADGNVVADAKPALSGAHEIDGKTYRTSWDILVEHVTPWTIERAAEFCELPEDKIREAIQTYIDASPHACFTRGQKVEFSINTSGISQAFTIMMALAGNFDTKGGPEHRPRAGHGLRLVHVRRRAEPAGPHGRAAQGNGHEHQEAVRVPEHRLPADIRCRRRHGRARGDYAELWRPGHLTVSRAVSAPPPRRPWRRAIRSRSTATGSKPPSPSCPSRAARRSSRAFKNLDFFVNVDMYMTPLGRIGRHHPAGCAPQRGGPRGVGALRPRLPHQPHVPHPPAVPRAARRVQRRHGHLLRVRRVHGRGHVLEGQVRLLQLHVEGSGHAARQSFRAPISRTSASA